MRCILILFLCAFAKYACSEGNEISPCSKSDHSCFVNMVRQFTKKVIEGIPDHGVKSLDPVIIPSIDYEIIRDTIDHFTDVNITGMKNLEVLDANIAESVTELKLKMNLNIISDVMSEFKNVPKTIFGVFRAKIGVEILSKYGVEAIPNENGERYFTLLPETTTCESTVDPEIIINPELLDNFYNDPDLKDVVEAYNKDMLNLNKQQTCHIAKAAVAKLLENFRIASKILPVEKYLTDI